MKDKVVGVIDIGSNSIKLVTAHRPSSGRIEVLDFVLEEVRIGEGLIGAPPLIDPNALRVGTDAVVRLVAAARDADEIAIVATSAVRDAHNRQDFINAIESATGHTLRVLSGDEEATFIGIGIRSDPSLKGTMSFSLLDLGGGSLECIQFSDSQLKGAESMQLGAVRLAARFIEDRAVPLSLVDEKRIREHVLETWRRTRFAPASSPSPTAVITGGAGGVVENIVGKENVGDGLPLSDFTNLAKQICSATEQERIEEIGIPPSRADIFPVAMVTLASSLEYLGCEKIRFSRYNLRFGLASTMLP